MNLNKQRLKSLISTIMLLVINNNNEYVDFVSIDCKLYSKVIHQATFLFVIEK